MRNILVYLTLIALAHGAAWGDPHREAANCRLTTSLTQACWSNCVQCHEHTDPIVPLDIYVKGDAQLCERCHPKESIPVSGTPLLRFVSGGGGNHPVEIIYSPEGARTVLVPSPTGPKLFTDTDGNNPKLQCSTCHDPMSRSVNLLRINNDGSSLCLSCHQK